MATAGVFAANGFLAALWVAHIPAIAVRTDVGPEVLGGLLLLLGGFAFIGMQICGPALDRWGSRPLIAVSLVALAATVQLPAWAGGTVALGVGMAAFGLTNGSLDVAMNAHAVAVERAYGRPIMSSFHGWFSVGGLIGAGAVAALLWAGAPVPVTVAAGGLLGLAVVAAVAGPLRLPVVAEAVPVQTGAEGAGGSSGSADGRSAAPWWHEVNPRRVALLAAVAFAVMLAEGTAYDWSALQVVEAFGTGEAVGALAFAAFSAAMTVARFGMDRLVASAGAVRVVRYGSLIGAAGMILTVTAPVPAVAIIGWVVFGLGLAGCIPQLFTAAGNLTAAQAGRLISLVVGCGYLGMLAGPAIIGIVGGRTGLNGALLIIVGILVAAAIGAGVVRPRGEDRVSADMSEWTP